MGVIRTFTVRTGYQETRDLVVERMRKGVDYVPDDFGNPNYDSVIIVRDSVDDGEVTEEDVLFIFEDIRGLIDLRSQLESGEEMLRMGRSGMAIRDMYSDVMNTIEALADQIDGVSLEHVDGERSVVEVGDDADDETG